MGFLLVLDLAWDNKSVVIILGVKWFILLIILIFKLIVFFWLIVFFNVNIFDNKFKLFIIVILVALVLLEVAVKY